MKFQDLFIPRWRHSSPEVRARAVAKITDVGLLEQISKLDDAESVREMALARLTTLSEKS
jgi:hypothetical protein